MQRLLRAALLWVRPLALGTAAACADGDGAADEAPTVDDPCEAEAPARCGFPEGATVTKNAVLVCEGGQWAEGHDCGNDETCRDDPARGAVACTDELDEVIYGEHTGVCAVEGAQSCSFDRDFVLLCQDRRWSIDTNCSTNVLHCGFVTAADDDTCDDANGCFVCA